MKIIFFGTPEFAAFSLDKIISHGYRVLCVVTAPDKKAGRGQKIISSAVKNIAQKRKVNILQPTNLKALHFQEELLKMAPDLIVVVAFRMLPKEVWALPRLGTINLHASLLPQYRGSAPINWAIMNGEEKTGLTTFFINEKIDCGDILLKKEMPIAENETAGELHDRMKIQGADLLIETIKGLESGTLPSYSQEVADNQNLKTAPKIFKKDGEINWNWSAKNIYNHVRGLSPYPCAYTQWNGIKFKIYKVEVQVTDTGQKDMGQPKVRNGNELIINCLDGEVKILELQQEGRKRMKIDAFLRGAENKFCKE